MWRVKQFVTSYAKKAAVVSEGGGEEGGRQAIVLTWTMETRLKSKGQEGGPTSMA